MMFSANPKLTARKAVEILYSTARRLPDLEGKVRTGATLDCGAAVEAAAAQEVPQEKLHGCYTPNKTVEGLWLKTVQASDVKACTHSCDTDHSCTALEYVVASSECRMISSAGLADVEAARHGEDEEGIISLTMSCLHPEKYSDEYFGRHDACFMEQSRNMGEVLDSYSTNSRFDCRDACRGSRECVATNYDVKNRICSLLSSIGEVQPAADMTTSTDACVYEACFHQDRAFEGEELQSSQSFSSREECVEACVTLREEGCEFITWHDNQCHMHTSDLKPKNQVGALRADMKCVAPAAYGTSTL